MIRTLSSVFSSCTKTSRPNSKSVATHSLFICAHRLYTPPAEAVKLYQTNFSDGPFPIECATSEPVQYAQFLFKLNGSHGQYLNDFETMKKLKLPIFWERSGSVTDLTELAKAVSPNFLFTLRWIQVDGNIELLDAVMQYYETLVNAEEKQLPVKVYTTAGGSKDAKIQAAAKSLVNETLKNTPELKSVANWTLNYSFHTDDTIPTQDGFYAEFYGRTVSTIEHSSSDKRSTGDVDVDYTNVKPVKTNRLPAQWEENIETDVLRSYYDQLSKLDVEEQTLGV